MGQTAWEEVNIITKGGNYGWPDAEGLSPNKAFVNPVYSYPPALGRSIVGAMFYPYPLVKDEVTRPSPNDETSEPPQAGAYLFPEKWRGRFFFADWANHWIKALDPESPANVIHFARNLNGPVALEPAPDGSIYVLNRGTIWRDPKQFVENSGSLVRIRYVGDEASLATNDAEKIPADLKATGRFSSYQPLTTNNELISFTLNSPPWQPGVNVQRWISIPKGKQITWRNDGEWQFPNGAIAVQHFTLNGGGNDGAAFETQVLWFNGPRTVRAGAYR